MRRFAPLPVLAIVVGSAVFSVCAQNTGAQPKVAAKETAVKETKVLESTQAQPVQVAQQTPAAAKTASAPQAKPAAQAAAPAKPAAAPGAGGDTLELIARVVEIPGTFPPNDLYNYVYIMKYRVLKIVKGDYKGQDILIGQYNPLIPRKQIKDAMDKYVDGDIQKFEVGAKHKLVLVTPIDKVWKDALEDEYFDSDLPKYYALRTDTSK